MTMREVLRRIATAIEEHESDITADLRPFEDNDAAALRAIADRIDDEETRACWGPRFCDGGASCICADTACCRLVLARLDAPLKCPQCGSLSPEKCSKPCTDPPCGAYRSVDEPGLCK
jgi:hypothetical protein